MAQPPAHARGLGGAARGRDAPAGAGGGGELFEANPPRFAAADVLVATEILSDGARRVDRIMKFSEYADAGIGQYWIIDLGSPTTLLAYVLVEGHYELSGEHTGTVTLGVAGHPVTLDLDALTAR